MRKWLRKIKMVCPRCGGYMVYELIGVESDFFKCECGFEVSVGKDFLWATVEKETSCTAG